MSYKRPVQSSHPIAKLSTTPAPKSLTANVKSSPHANTSRTSTPSVITAMMGMDSDSDDEKPLVFRTNVSRANTQLKNGTVLTKANADVARKGMGNVSRKSSVKGSDDSEDEKPLALRIAKCPAPVREHNAADSGDSDDDKPLVLKRSSNGVASNKTPVGKGDMSNAKKRPVDNKPKEEAPSKKLKLSKSLSEPSCISRVPKMEPSAPSNSNMKPSSKAPSQTPSSAMSKPSKTSSQSPSGTISKPLKTSLQSPLGAMSKLSKTEHLKPSSNIVSKTSSTLPSKASAAAKPSTPLPNALTNTAVKMDIDEDEDDIPLAQRIPVVKTIKKPIVKPIVKPSTGSLSSLAAKKVIEARKAKFNQLQKKLTPKKKEGRSDKNAPVGGGEQKWTHLEHCGVIFPPPYKPHGIKMLYEGKPVTLTPEQEEVATMFAVMRDTDYAQKKTFLSNFWEDWKKILGPDHVIQNLEQCDFTPIYEWHLVEKEKKKQLSSEEKKRLKEEKLKQEEKYMWALVDGVKEKVGNFRVEPPGLFRGRGEHPKMGKLKRRIFPEDIVINIGKNVPIPECPIPGHRWKEIRHDNTVTWLAYWIDPINQREFKYVFLAASSSLKGQSDKEKYEKARTLKNYIENIRKTYTKNFTSSDMTKKQIAVATYLIDRLALRAGNEKDDDEADTVGCCSLKVEHVSLVPPKSLQFDFLGKDSIRYFNVVEVEEAVYKAVGEFKKSKKSGDDLFDKLDTSKLNAHLKNIMPQLTAKVFRTYNASITLDTLLVDTDGQTVPEKLAAYQWANKEVAILCNHQRSVSKSHGAQMEKLETKMTELEELLQELRTDLSRAKKGKPPLKDADGKPKRNQNPEALEKKIAQTEHKVEKMKLDMRIKDDLKTVALGTSKINYMDPRITVAWCKRHEVPIEKIFNKSLLAKFAWAMDVSMDYRF